MDILKDKGLYLLKHTTICRRSLYEGIENVFCASCENMPLIDIKK